MNFLNFLKRSQMAFDLFSEIGKCEKKIEKMKFAETFKNDLFDVIWDTSKTKHQFSDFFQKKKLISWF